MPKVKQTEFWTNASLQTSCAVAPPPSQTATLPGKPDRTLVEPKSSVRERADIIYRIEDGEIDLFDPFAPTPAAAADAPPAPGRAVPVPEPEPAGYWRHRVVRAGQANAQQPISEPRFNMARFLTLSGSLDSGDRNDRWFVLPRRRFRPRPNLRMQTPDTHDTLMDLRSAPRNFSLISFFRTRGWLGS